MKTLPCSSLAPSWCRKRTGGVAFIAVIFLASQISACTLVSKTVELPFEAVRYVIPGSENLEAMNPVDLQEEMLRFADHLMASTIRASSTLERDGKPIDQTEMVKIKVRLTSETLAMVSTSNSIGTLIDLLMLSSAARIRVEDTWMPKVYGESAKPLVQALRDREREIWKFAKKVLPEPQLQELRSAIEIWRKETLEKATTDLETIASLQLVNEVKNASRQRADVFTAASVFQLLDIDPLAGLDPATRELTETRLFGDRALFVGQRMPQLMEWQMELLTARAAELPEVQKMVDGTALLAASSDRASHTLADLPGLIRSERENLFSFIKSEKQGMVDLGKQLDHSFAEGSRMSESVDKTLKTYSALQEQLEAISKTSSSEPFRIRDWTESAVQITHAAQSINQLLTNLPESSDPETHDRLATQFDALVRQAKGEGESLLRYAFVTGILFVAATCLLLLATGVAYRLLTLRLFPSARH